MIIKNLRPDNPMYTAEFGPILICYTFEDVAEVILPMILLLA